MCPLSLLPLLAWHTEKNFALLYGVSALCPGGSACTRDLALLLWVPLPWALQHLCLWTTFHMHNAEGGVAVPQRFAGLDSWACSCSMNSPSNHIINVYEKFANSMALPPLIICNVHSMQRQHNPLG